MNCPMWARPYIRVGHLGRPVKNTCEERSRDRRRKQPLNKSSRPRFLLKPLNLPDIQEGFLNPIDP